MEQRTLKISKPLLLRRILATLIFSGSSGTSGVSILSLNPYLCGLSSGSGEGAGIVGDSADRTCASSDGTGGRSLKSAAPSVCESGRSADLQSRMVVAALRGIVALSSVIVMFELECTLEHTSGYRLQSS